MRPRRCARGRTASVLLASALACAACSLGEATHETVVYPARKQASAMKVCEPPFAAPDLDELAPCMGGLGRCYDKTKVPTTDDLEPCDDATVCLPNKVIAAAGGKLAPCTFLGKNPGACVELAIPKLVEFKDVLEQDVCEEDERCVPCENPEDGQPTPFCEPIGVYENACTGGEGPARSASETCCHLAGVCMTEDVLDDDQRESLERDQCREGTLCVPASQAVHEPVKCSLLGASGVCIDLCFAKMLKGAGTVMRAGCGPLEVCMPCAIGAGQGMRGC